MSDIVSPLLQWLNANPEWAGFVTFAISAGESIAILGTLVPGTITMTAIGTLAGAGVIPLWSTIFWAILGAIVGDGVSYWIGHYFKDGLRQVWPFRNNPGILTRGERYVHQYGVMSVFFGRFVGPVRALVPVVAGMLGMKPLQFTIANITSAIGWAPIYMLPGILLGAASLELPPEIAMHVIIVLFLIGLFVILCLWIIYKLFQLIHTQTNQLQNWIWNNLKRSHYLSPITVLLKHHDPDKTHGQLSLALLFIVVMSAFFLLVYYVKVHGAAHITANEVIYHLFRGIRNNTFDGVMLSITLLGQKQIQLPVLGMLVMWLCYCKRWRAAVHTVILGVLAAGGVVVGKLLIKSPRPWGIHLASESYSMPSGHATLSMIIFMGLAFLLANTLQKNKRWPIYTIGLIIVILIGISRLYLGAHWLTDIFAGWLLGAALLILTIVSYERVAEKPVYLLNTFLISLGALLASYALFYYTNIDKLKINYMQINRPLLTIPMKAWWENNHLLSNNKTNLFGLQSERINIQWMGYLDEIQKALIKAGWDKPPSRDLISTLHRIADVSSTQFLPLVSPQYLDKKPALILTRQSNGSKGFLVIRLWRANRIIQEFNMPLWVGTIGVIPRSYSWLFKKKNLPHFTLSAAQIFPKPQATELWEYKTLHYSSGSSIYIRPARVKNN